MIAAAHPVVAFLLFAFVVLAAPVCRGGDHDDPYLRYEESDTPEVTGWVERQNAKTLAALASNPTYDEFSSYILRYLDSDTRIVYPTFYRNSDIVRNYWRDADHPQGYTRETTLDRFFAKDYQWETVLDIDELSRRENTMWVYGGATYPFKVHDRAMIALSDGGKDATELREYDFAKREFVADGFFLPESKSDVDWLDIDTLLVSSAMTEDEQTTSGYPRVVKVWKRGTPFSEAETVFAGDKTDLSVRGGTFEIADEQLLTVFVRALDFYNYEIHVYENGGTRRFNIPTDAMLGSFHKGNFFITLKSDWTVGGATFKQGSVLYAPYESLFTDSPELRVFFEPTATVSFDSLDATDDYVYLATMDNVQNRIYQYELVDGEWIGKTLPVPPMSLASVIRTPKGKGFLLTVESGFLQPTGLYRVDEKSFSKSLVQSLPQEFEPGDYVVKQEFAVSADQTRIPYFIVHRKDLPLNGDNPTLQYGYGGFMTSLQPSYIPIQEHVWLRDGGVFVMANIRGGGEYGPAWHEQALKGNRHKAFEDFIAVSEDLIAKKITSPRRLGIQGGSNGGLLTGAVMTMRPDLYNAVIINVPLLDMLRYTKLPPGASWIGEYGDPDNPEEREFLLSYSPYQNLKKGVRYPVPFLMTSSKDDRVHPGHARKFAKRLEEFGQDFFFYEETDGGHGGGANNRLAAKSDALQWLYLRSRLMPEKANGE